MITRKFMKVIILGSFCILGLITAIPGFMINAQKTNINSVKSALLNPKYVSEVNMISLSFPSDDGINQLVFKKKNVSSESYNWICTRSDGLVFPVNAKLVEQLIDNASQTRSMAVISDSYSAWQALGLAENNAINITFENDFSEGGQLFSSLYFGYENADSTMIYVRNDRKSTSWRIQDDISSYLSDTVSFWADQHLLPTGSSDETDESRTLITAETADGVKMLYNSVSDGSLFDETIHSLLSLRSSEIVSVSDFVSEAPQAIPIMKITLAGPSGNESNDSYGFTVYEAVFEDGVEYFARNFGILSGDDAEYLFRISEWTFSKLIESLAF